MGWALRIECVFGAVLIIGGESFGIEYTFVASMRFAVCPLLLLGSNSFEGADVTNCELGLNCVNRWLVWAP